VRSGKPEKCYPITIHTVTDGESVWDIGKKYKVSEDRITHYNKEESIRPGNKIIIVK
jgi:LysM repeat protein